MKNFKGILLLAAMVTSYGISAVPMQFGAPVPTIQGNNYRQFSAGYRGYLINQNNQVDPQWVAGAIMALQQDGLYNSNNFLNVLWSDIEGLVNYYAQGNQAFKNATQQSLMNVYNSVAGRATQVQQPVQVQQVQAPRQVQLPTVSFTIRSIMDGVLGNAYASKAKEIYSYDGTLAARRGDPALVSKLQAAIGSANANQSPQDKVVQLKTALDSIYSDLVTYRARDNAQRSPQASVLPAPPVPAAVQLTFESILGGALGEPYTSKVREMNNDASLQQFANDVRDQIKFYNSAYYPDPSVRINNIKAIIDRNHGFLLKHRANAVPATAQLTFESILNGALGEPYTSKAKEIMNSNVDTYVNALQTDVNKDLVARYPNEAIKINNIKATIDKLHRFLLNYMSNQN